MDSASEQIPVRLLIAEPVSDFKREVAPGQ